MKIAYSRTADVLTIRLGKGRPVDSRDIAEGVIVHLDKRGVPVEIEILDATKVMSAREALRYSDPLAGQKSRLAA
ncbi:MAG: DUF2283 domain-containing protein [Nitrospirae bacterium]|nr:DUF2283 domain-containing protein [Nitrospirota bacterium]